MQPAVLDNERTRGHAAQEALRVVKLRGFWMHPKKSQSLHHMDIGSYIHGHRIMGTCELSLALRMVPYGSLFHPLPRESSRSCDTGQTWAP